MSRPEVTVLVLPRRPFVLSLAGMGVVSTLAACSSAGSADASGTPASSLRQVDTAHGAVDVPVDPQRIVSLQSYATESLWDLGLEPIAVEDGGREYVPQRYLERWDAAQKISSGATVDLERIAALEPDLIVGVDVPHLSDLHDQLTAIAPTAFVAFGDDWSAYTPAVAEFTGTQDAQAALQKTFEATLADVAARHAEVLGSSTWDVVQGGFDEGNYWIYGHGSAMGDLLGRLGATLASASTNAPVGDVTSVSYEQADLLADADFVLYYANGDGTPANDIDLLFGLRSFQQLPAVLAGHLVAVPDFLPGSYSDAAGALQSIDVALTALGR